MNFLSVVITGMLHLKIENFLDSFRSTDIDLVVTAIITNY